MKVAWRFLALALLAILVSSADAGDKTPSEARSGLSIATDAARAWSADAALVYVENDEDVTEGGLATRWGYLFFSPSRGYARVYSVEEWKIVVGEDLTMDIEAPPVIDGWVDSGAALAAAEKKSGAKYRKENGGTLSTMLLMRGAFNAEKPDRTTWTLIYRSDTAPSLFVVVDAQTAQVVRTWRG